MATIYTRYPSQDYTTCPQRKEIKEEQLGPTVRRLSESSERRRSEQRRRSSVISEKTSVMGSLESIQAGKLPTNDHLNSIINRLIGSEVIEHNKKSMSPDGQMLLNDFQGLLVALQHALHTKNRDELFQSMIYHVRKSELSVVNSADEADTEQVKKEVKSGAKAILEINKLLLFNSKFRALLYDILFVAEDTLGGAIQVDGKMMQDNAAKRSTRAAAVTTNQQDIQPVIHQQLDNIPAQKQQDQQILAATNTNAISSSEIIRRLKEIFSTIQKHPEYQSAISTIFNLFNIWGDRLSVTTVSTNTSSSPSSSSESDGGNNFMITAAVEAKAIIEDWAQGKSLDPIIEKSDNLKNTAKSDSELSSLYHKVIFYSRFIGSIVH